MPNNSTSFSSLSSESVHDQAPRVVPYRDLSADGRINNFIEKLNIHLFLPFVGVALFRGIIDFFTSFLSISVEEEGRVSNIVGTIMHGLLLSLAINAKIAEAFEQVEKYEVLSSEFSDVEYYSQSVENNTSESTCLMLNCFSTSKDGLCCNDDGEKEESYDFSQSLDENLLSGIDPQYAHPFAPRFRDQNQQLGSFIEDQDEYDEDEVKEDINQLNTRDNEFRPLAKGVANNITWSMFAAILYCFVTWQSNYDENKTNQFIAYIFLALAMIPYLTAVGINQFFVAHNRYTLATIPLIFHIITDLLFYIINCFYQDHLFYAFGKFISPIVGLMGFLFVLYKLSLGADEKFLCFNSDVDLCDYREQFDSGKWFRISDLKSFDRQSFILHAKLALTATLNWGSALVLVCLMAAAAKNNKIEDELASITIPIFAVKSMARYLEPVTMVGMILFRQYNYLKVNPDDPINRNYSLIRSNVITYLALIFVPVFLISGALLAYARAADLSSDNKNILSYSAISLFFYGLNRITVSAHCGFRSFLWPLLVGASTVLSQYYIVNKLELANAKDIEIYYARGMLVQLASCFLNISGLYYLLEGNEYLGENVDPLLNNCSSFFKKCCSNDDQESYENGGAATLSQFSENYHENNSFHVNV